MPVPWQPTKEEAYLLLCIMFIMADLGFAWLDTVPKLSGLDPKDGKDNRSLSKPEYQGICWRTTQEK